MRDIREHVLPKSIKLFYGGAWLIVYEDLCYSILSIMWNYVTNLVIQGCFLCTSLHDMLFYIIGCNLETKYYLYMNLNCMY